MSQQQQRKPDVGLGYKSTYKDKNGSEQTYLSVMIREEQLAELTPENGVYKLSIFPNLGEKKNPKSPDFVVKASLSKKKPVAVAQGRANVAATGTNKFPF